MTARHLAFAIIQEGISIDWRNKQTMPRLGFLNQFHRLILLSPIHGVMSKRFLLLTYRGRKTGRSHEFPVAYVRHDRELIMTTDDPWWHNFEGGSSVQIRIAGQRFVVTARAIAHPDQVEPALRHLIAAHRPYSALADVTRFPDGSLDVAGAAQRRALLRVSLQT